MKPRTKAILRSLLALVLSIPCLYFGHKSLKVQDQYRSNKAQVKTLENKLTFKKMEEQSLKDEINQGREALRQLDQIEAHWKDKEVAKVDSRKLEPYLFTSNLQDYPQFQEGLGGPRSSPFYEEETVDALSRSLALRQSLGRLKELDLEMTLAADSAVLRRMGSIHYFYESNQPGAWYALLKGHYKDKPSLDAIVDSMQGQMESTLAFKIYLGEILSLISPIPKEDLTAKKALLLNEEEEAKISPDYKQVFGDASYTASFLLDSYFYGLDDLKIKAKSLSTNDFTGMVRAYTKDKQIYFLTIKTEKDLVIAYFSKSGLLLSLFNIESGEAYYLRDGSDLDNNHWAQIANLAYQLIERDLEGQGQ